MLTSESAALTVQIAKGLIKLVKRVDLVVAEKEIVQAPLALPAPELGLMPTKARMRKALTDLVKAPKGDPDPLGPDREAIEAELAKGVNADKGRFFAFVEQYLPAIANERQLDLNASFVKALREARPDWAEDPEVRIAAFYVSSGRDLRNKSYSWRIALTVVDVLAEFGGENAALFTRDERVQGVVGAVLKRFGESDVQKIDSTSGLLHAALNATLNGTLDAKDKLGIHNDWLDAILDSLAKARNSVPEEDRAEFLLGLVGGRGYPSLVGALLESAAGRINDDQVVNFKDIAAHFLTEVAGIVKEKESFRNFFDDHWGDLLRAGLRAVEKNEAALLGDRKLLGTILARVAGDLAKHPNNRLLSEDSLFGIVNSVAAAAAENPEQIEELLAPDKRWLSKLIESVSGTVADRNIREVFTKEGVGSLFKDAFRTFSEHPELIAQQNELAGALVGGVLKELADVRSFGSHDLATAAVSGALSGIAANPDVVEFRYPELIASLAKKVAVLVKDRKLTGVQGKDILRNVTESLAENPQILLDVELKLAEAVVNSVAGAAKGKPLGLVAGITLSQIVEEAISALARTGRAALANHPAEELVQQLEMVVGAGLTRAESELGNRIGLPSLPNAMGLLISAWAQGQIAQLDPDSQAFKQLFSELAEKATQGDK